MSDIQSNQELALRFKELVKDQTWLRATAEQFIKDVHSSGASLEDKLVPDTVEGLYDFVKEVVTSIRTSSERWKAFVYRVDLPANVNLDSFSDVEMAEMILLRSFQKVWLRRQFSSGEMKDNPVDKRKHLKP